MTRMRRPVMIAVGGMSCSGKSTLAHALSMAIPGAVLLDADVVRKKMFGVTPLTPLPPDAYSEKSIKKFIKFIRAEAARNLKSHDVVIVTGLFTDERTSTTQAEFAKSRNADFIGIFLDVPYSTLFNRARARQDTPSDADMEVLKRQSINSLHLNRKDAAWALISSDQPFELTVNEALRVIEKSGRKMKLPSPKAALRNN